VLYVDTNILIGAFELPDPPAALVSTLLERASGSPLITSTITLSEVLVGPLRRGDGALERFYRRLFRRTDVIRLKPVTQPVLLDAAVLRAITPMRLPDAIHVATAERAGCTIVLSQDKRLMVRSPMIRIDPFESAPSAWS
jgi:predicted nucleic acid-binding protein